MCVCVCVVVSVSMCICVWDKAQSSARICFEQNLVCTMRTFSCLSISGACVCSMLHNWGNIFAIILSYILYVCVRCTRMQQQLYTNSSSHPFHFVYIPNSEQWFEYVCVYNMRFKIYIFLYITNKGGNFYNCVCMCYGRANLFSITCSCIYKCGKSSHLKTIIYYHIESIYILPTNCILLYTLIYMFKHIRLIRKINTFNNFVCVYKKKE